MTLPASGVISLGNIATEFGGSTPHGISEYYRSGAYVPNTGPNAGIPTSGVVAFSNYYNGSAIVYGATLPSGSGPNFGQNMEFLTNVFDGSPSGHGIQFTTTGVWQYVDVFGSSIVTTYPSAGPTTWLTGGGGAGDYEIMMETVAGTPYSGSDPNDTWLNLGSADRTWYCIQDSFSSHQWQGIVRIRRASTGPEYDNCTLIMYSYFDV